MKSKEKKPTKTHHNQLLKLILAASPGKHQMVDDAGAEGEL
jgi:hypothetical protein